MVGGETEGPDSATKKSSLNMMQNKQMSRWEKLSSIAKDLHDSFRLDAKKRSIEGRQSVSDSREIKGSAEPAFYE